MKLTTGYKKPIASSGDDALELSSNNSYLLLAGGGHKALSELVSPADLTTALSDYVTIGSNQTITGVKTFSLTINANITGNANTVDGYHASDFAFAENTYGTTGNFVNSIFKSNCIAKGDLGLVGFDNSSITVELYEATSGNSYPSSPTKTINTSNATYGVNFRKGTYAIMHSCAAGSKLKIIVKSGSGYIKSVGIYVATGGNIISFSSTVDSTTKTGSFSTLGSWHVFSCMDSILKSVTLELNTTNVNCEVIIGGFRTYITSPSNLRFPGIANSVESVSWSNITDKPTSLPANGGNADYAESAGDAGTLGGWHKSAFATANHTHTTSEITNFPTIGNGALHIKVNGTELTPEGGIFTANKGGDSTIDLKESLATRPELNTLGSKVDKIDTSITKLNTAIQVENPFNDPEDDDEETIETNNEPFTEKIGNIKLKFWNITTTYTDLPVYNVWVNHVADVIEPFGSVSYCYDIFLVTGITNLDVSSVGITSDSYKPFFIRGANINNKVCDKFDVRGNGNINTARATIIGEYMHLQCRLKLQGGDSGTGKYIMEEAKNKTFNALLCLRQTP